ncbi:hypothetical protein I4U23_005707 [Adineta vaga]|nr:hypothetical protein I4U23_005707 [Adineta vaga]
MVSTWYEYGARASLVGIKKCCPSIGKYPTIRTIAYGRIAELVNAGFAAYVNLAHGVLVVILVVVVRCDRFVVIARGHLGVFEVLLGYPPM